MYYMRYSSSILGSGQITTEYSPFLRRYTQAQAADPDTSFESRMSSRAMACRDEAVRAFLDRHGFLDVNSPRKLDESLRIQMKPVYPIEVAADLGKVFMVNMLLDAGAIIEPRPPSAPSSPSSSRSLSSKGKDGKGKDGKGKSFSFAFWRGNQQREEVEEVLATSPQLPLRSCLSNGSQRSSNSDGIGSTCGEEPISTIWI